MSWACDTRQSAAPERLGTSTTPNWRCWFEAEPMGKGKTTAPGFCSEAGRAWIAAGFWEAFRGAFLLVLLPEHQATATNLSILPGGSWRHWIEASSATLEASLHRAPRATQDTLHVKAKPRRCGSEGPTPKQGSSPGLAPPKATQALSWMQPHSKGSPVISKAAVLVRSTRETGVAKIKRPGQMPLSPHQDPCLESPAAAPPFLVLCCASSRRSLEPKSTHS